MLCKEIVAFYDAMVSFSGLYYNSIYDRKNYDASYDRTSGVGIYDASVVIYDASSVNYDAKVL